MNVGDILVVGPLFEQIAQVDNICALDRRSRVPVFRLGVPDFQARDIALKEQCDDTEVTMRTNTSLELVGILSLRRVMEKLVECHWLVAELIEVVHIVSERHSDGLHDLLGEVGDTLQVVHASLPEMGAESGGPDVGAVGELLGNYLRVVQRKITGDVVPFLEVGLGICLDHLPVHNLVPAVVIILGWHKNVSESKE